jgi:hypothetical protein
MRMDSAEDRAFLRALARDIVAIKAAEELEVFDNVKADLFLTQIAKEK